MGWPPRAVWNVPIVCQCYGPGKPSSLPSTEGDFTPTAYGWIGRETRYRSTDRTVVVLWIVVEALFLGSNGSAHCCWWLREWLLYVDFVRYVWTCTICGLSMESVWRVGQVFPYRVYIALNRRDSRIWVTTCLWQSSRRELNGMVDGLNWNYDALL
jgi:hypothetical protein